MYGRGTQWAGACHNRKVVGELQEDSTRLMGMIKQGVVATSSAIDPATNPYI